MRASIKALGLAMALALSCQAAVAGWYTARGSAPIIDDDVTMARRNAIDDALRNASLQAGADVSIEQVLENGTLLNEKMQIRSHSPIKTVRVIEEQENGKVVSVMIKALIDDNVGSDCYAGSIKKTILPFTFRYRDPEASQSAAGIEEIDRYLTDLIYNGVGQSPALTMLPPDDMRLLVRPTSSGSDYNFQRILDSISRRSQAQFIIVGSITSASKSDVGNNVFTKMLYNPTRTIRFNVQVFDVYTGRQILKKDYEGDADWTLQGHSFNLRSDKFATSEYGQRITQLSKYAIADIVTRLRCQNPMARIVQVGNDTIRINLGENANVKRGMQFHLLHRSDYQDRHNMTYYQTDNTGSTYKVVDVSPMAATLAPVDIHNQLINVMLDDIVELKP